MDFIIDFYKNLDALDMFIFWGVIIVIGLLLIFSIILVNKNNKLTKIVNEREKLNEKDDFLDIPIYSAESNSKINRNSELSDTIFSNKKDFNEELFKINDGKLLEDLPDLPIDKFEKNDAFNLSNVNNVSHKDIEKDNKFKIYNNTFNAGFTNDTSQKSNDETNSNIQDKMTIPTKGINKEFDYYTGKYDKNNISLYKSDINANNDNERGIFRAEELIPEYDLSKKSMLDNNKNSNNQKELYQKNVLKEMSFNQTSPINITSTDKLNDNSVMIFNKEEKNENVTTKESEIQGSKISSQLIEKKHIQNKDSAKQARDEYIKKEIERYKQEIIKREQELNNNEKISRGEPNEAKIESKDIGDDNYDDEIDRTAYEIEQEENAIISYKELMEKKDSIKTIDEEEAIISIEELMNRSKKEVTQNKNDVYVLNDESENNDFISELKKFRKEL